jgi:D-alanyl-D-alanine carboxypeptidase
MLAFAALLPSLTPPASAADVASSAAHAATTDRAPLQAGLQGLVDAGATGAMGLVDDGKHLIRATAGVGRLDPPAPLRVDDEVRVASITKTFMSVLILQQVAEHRLRLDDDVQRWLPDLVPNGSAITVRMLLNHTSGLYDYGDDPSYLPAMIADRYRNWTPTELIGLATRHDPLFAPGEGWSYSNTNYILVGMIIERVTGREVPDLVRDRITEPLHLADTFLDTTGTFRSHYAHGYLPPSVTSTLPPGLGDGGYFDVSDVSPSSSWTAGALVSTAPDLSRFFQALMSGRLLPRAILRQMLTTVDTEGGLSYGLGIFRFTTPCGTVWGHGGLVFGYASYAVTDDSGTRSAIVLVPTLVEGALAAALDKAQVAAVCTMLHRTPHPATPGSVTR